MGTLMLGTKHKQLEAWLEMILFVSLLSFH